MKRKTGDEYSLWIIISGLKDLFFNNQQLTGKDIIYVSRAMQSLEKISIWRDDNERTNHKTKGSV